MTSSLVESLAKIQNFDYALQVLSSMPNPSLKSMNTLIDQACQAQNVSIAWKAYLLMKEKDVVPDSFTFSSLLRASRSNK